MADDHIQEGHRVSLRDEPDCIIPAGEYVVSKVNPDGSFHVGGNTAVWPRRVVKRRVGGEAEPEA